MQFDYEYWILTLVVTASVPISLRTGFNRLRASRLAQDLPTSKIRSAAQGYAELEGTGKRIAESTECPLTYTPCLWRRYKVEEYKQRGKNKSWVTIEDQSSEEPFWLEDATGRCRLDPKGAEIMPAVKRQWYGRSEADAQKPDRKILFFRKYRYTEQFLWVDQPLYALGDFRTLTTDREAVIARAVRDRLDAWRKDPAMMKRLDVNKDGQIDQREWTAAQRMARLQVEREGVQVDEPVHTLSKAGENPYIISGKPQKEVIRSLRSSARGSLAWFLIALPASVFLILWPFGYF